MKLNLRGHEDRYAIEQSLLAFFPEERPVYEGEDGDSHAEVTLHEGNVYATGVTTLTYGGKTARGEARVRTAGVSDAYERERLRQRALKLSFSGRPGRHRRDAQLGRADGHPPGQAGADHAGGRHDPRPGGPGTAGYVLRLPGAAASGAGERRGGPEGQERPAPRGHLSVHRHPLLPHPLRLLQLRVGVGGKIPQADGAVSGGADGGGGGRGPHGEGAGLRIKSFYMGGGTPTTLSASQMDALLTAVNRNFDLSNCVEYCIEAGRPDTIDREKLQVLLDHGADRISVNPQSLEPRVLSAIGRKHSPEDIEKAMELATSMGFPHVNMDLIAGLPADTPEGFRRTLDTCLTFGADNITVHTLSLKKGSRILLEGLPIPSAEDVAAMLDYADPALREKGFAPYYLYRQKYMSGSFENVGWCISGAEGLYNIYIMEELHSILSLGAGGSTKMVDAKRNRIERVFHPKFPLEYIQRPEKLTENLEAFRRFHQEMAR